VDVKQILLRSVHGTAKPGGVLGILGKSGAGKSLLLDLLAGRTSANGPALDEGCEVIVMHPRVCVVWRMTDEICSR
jgi:ABC-type multidrug transport system ATPase subunit